MSAGTALFLFVIIFGLLVAAIICAVTGHMLAAIFLAILWVGLNNNTAQ